MIGKLKGVVDGLGDDHAIIDVHGVGYVVQASSRTLQNLTLGEAVVLFIETQVREDAIRLFGFVAEQEREWFKLLQSVQGVGAKVALAILSIMTGGEIATAIGTGDKAMVARAPGVGPKLAQRIVSELKDKSPALTGIDLGLSAFSTSVSTRSAPKPVADAVSALGNLGYPQAHAFAAVSAAVQSLGDEAETSALIRFALKELAR
jgi:Holliday junction DNA helicase RuvA